jgi:hypothetical protein
MADQVSSNARAKRKQDEFAPQGRQRSARQRKFDQDLAALEAMLSDDLQHSPPLAANDEQEQEHEQAPELESPKARLKPPSRSRSTAKKSGEPRRARRAPPAAENFNGAPMPQVDRSDWMRAFEAELLREEDEPAFSRMHPVDLDEYADGRTEPVFEAREPRPTPERNPLNAGERFYTKPDDRRAPITRALRIGATVFSLLALIGVSALLVLLAVGGERLSTSAVANLPAGAKQTAAAEKAAPATLPVEEDDVLVTGATNGPRDPSRIAPAGEPMHALRGGGTVRPVAPGETVAQPQQVAENAPALRAPDASSDKSVLTAEPARTPQAEVSAPAEPAQTSLPSAPAKVASIGNSRPAQPQATVRSVPVTSHVNLRATGDNDAKVVAVVPAGKNVDVIECKQWCEVSYNDQQGYIHKRFLKE